MPGREEGTLRVLIVDDEPRARRRLTRMLGHMRGVSVAGEAGDGIEALSRIQELEPDVVLLDIRMPGLDGLNLARGISERTAVIFVTAFDAHAVEAFEANAVDYLLKPVETSRLEAALRRAARRRREWTRSERERVLSDLLVVGAQGTDTRVTARAGDTIHVFDAREISRFRAANPYSLLIHEGKDYLIEESLGRLGARFGALGFLRVHRSELVNLSRVRELRLEDGGAELLLADGQRAPISRRMLSEVKRRLGVGRSDAESPPFPG